MDAHAAWSRGVGLVLGKNREGEKNRHVFCRSPKAYGAGSIACQQPLRTHDPEIQSDSQALAHEYHTPCNLVLVACGYRFTLAISLLPMFCSSGHPYCHALCHCELVLMIPGAGMDRDRHGGLSVSPIPCAL